MEIIDPFVHILDKLLNTDSVIFILLDYLSLHLLVDLVQKFKICHHVALFGSVMIVELDVEFVLLVEELLMLRSVDGFLFVGLSPGLLVVGLAVKT